MFDTVGRINVVQARKSGMAGRRTSLFAILISYSTVGRCAGARGQGIGGCNRTCEASSYHASSDPQPLQQLPMHLSFLLWCVGMAINRIGADMILFAFLNGRRGL